MRNNGDSSELSFASRAIAEGLVVAFPFGNTEGYDVLVDNGSRIYKVQVKGTTTSEQRRYGTCWLSSTKLGGDNRPYTTDDADFFAIQIIPLDVWYIIPIAENTKTKQTFYPDLDNCWMDKYKERWGLLK